MNVEKYGKSNFIADTVEPLSDGENNGFKYTLNAVYDRATTIKYDWTYTKVAPDATFDAKAKYYAWDVDGYELLSLTEDTFTPSTKTYYTRAWELKDVKCDYTTLKKNLSDTIIDQLFSTAYSESQIALYLDTAEKPTSITKVDKVYDELLKEYED